MNITDINLVSYDLTVIEFSEMNDSSKIPARTFKLRFGGILDPNMEQLMKDMNVMNSVRGQMYNPAVRDAYEQLLTVLALTAGDDKK